MKKIISVSVALIMGMGLAHGALNCCGTCVNQVGGNTNFDSSCTTQCCSGTMVGQPDANGVVRVEVKKTEVICATSSSGAHTATCITSREYKCAAGYYGRASVLSNTCQKCPYGGTSNVGTANITGCFLPNGSTGADDSGNFTIDGGACMYNILVIG